MGSIVYYPLADQTDGPVMACGHILSHGGLAFPHPEDKMERIAESQFIRRVTTSVVTVDDITPVETPYGYWALRGGYYDYNINPTREEMDIAREFMTEQERDMSGDEDDKPPAAPPTEPETSTESDGTETGDAGDDKTETGDAGDDKTETGIETGADDNKPPAAPPSSVDSGDNKVTMTLDEARSKYAHEIKEWALSLGVPSAEVRTKALAIEALVAKGYITTS